LGGPEARLKWGPLMTSSYSANRDKNFWSSLRYGHQRIRSWDYGITNVAGENAKGCSWYTTLNTESWVTRLAAQKLGNSKLASSLPTLFSSPISLHSPSINYKIHPFKSFTLSPFEKMLGGWYPEFVHIHVFMRIHETINNSQEDLKH